MAFDPYHKWLGIPVSEQPPNHYRLLAVGLFEDDPDVIETAADQRMALLRTFQSGQYSALSQKLLNELSAARICLLNPEKKAAYDSELRRRIDAAQRPQPVVPMARPLPVAPLATVTSAARLAAATEDPAIIVTQTRSARHTRHRRRHGLSSAAFAWLALAAVAAPAAVYISYLIATKPEPERQATPTVRTSERAPSRNAQTVHVPSEGSLRTSADTPATTRVDEPPIAVAPFNSQSARAHQEAWAKYLGVPVEQKNSIGMRLVIIPPGEFTMGSTPEEAAVRVKTIQDTSAHPDQLPPHRVMLTRPFLIGATEVTIGQFEAFVDSSTGYRTAAERLGGDSATENESDEKGRGRNWRTPGYPVSAESPLTQITWGEAAMFCNWLSERDGLRACYRQEGPNGWALVPSGNGYRLPTEAEWEYACRAGTVTIWPFANDTASFGEFCWFGGNSQGRTQRVGTKPPNAFGLHDMLGNVWEWCHDRFDGGYYSRSPKVDPSGPESGDARSVRGGSFDGGMYYHSSLRFNSPPSRRFGSGGFRVVRISTTGVASSASAPQSVASATRSTSLKELAGASDGLASSKTKAKEAFDRDGPNDKQRSLKDLANDEHNVEVRASNLAAKVIASLDQHTGAVTRVAFHRTMPLLASAGKDGQVLLWNLDTRSVQTVLHKFPRKEVWAIKFSPDGQLLAYANRNWFGSALFVKTLANQQVGQPVKDFKNPGGAVACIAYSPDGRLFAASQDDGTIRLWETSPFQEFPPLSLGDSVWFIAFGPVASDRKRIPEYVLAAGCKDGTIKLLRATGVKDKTGARRIFEVMPVAFPTQQGVTCVRFSSDGKLVGATRIGGLIGLYDARTGATVREMRATNGNSDWLSFHSQRPWIATAHWNDRVGRIWHRETGTILCELRGHTGGVFCAEFSPDGRQLATGSDDFSIKIWELSGPEVPTAPRGKKTKQIPLLVGE